MTEELLEEDFEILEDQHHQISNAISDASSDLIPDRAYRLYGALRRYSGSKFVSRKRIMTKLGWKRTKYTDALNELKQLGLVETSGQIRTSAGTFSKTKYRVHPKLPAFVEVCAKEMLTHSENNPGATLTSDQGKNIRQYIAENIGSSDEDTGLKGKPFIPLLQPDTQYRKDGSGPVPPSRYHYKTKGSTIVVSNKTKKNKSVREKDTHISESRFNEDQGKKITSGNKMPFEEFFGKYKSYVYQGRYSTDPDYYIRQVMEKGKEKKDFWLPILEYWLYQYMQDEYRRIPTRRPKDIQAGAKYWLADKEKPGRAKLEGIMDKIKSDEMYQSLKDKW